MQENRTIQEGKGREMEIGQVSNPVDPSVKREVNSANKKY